jgi:hypothetical protein
LARIVPKDGARGLSAGGRGVLLAKGERFKP